VGEITHGKTGDEGVLPASPRTYNGGDLATRNAGSSPYSVYRVFQKGLYNFERVYEFIQRTCAVF
jgi:hypothetical protein